MNTTFRPRSIPSRPEELAMSLICRWGGVSVEMGLGERIPASVWDHRAGDLQRKNLSQEELHAVLVMDQKSAEARRSFQMLQASPMKAKDLATKRIIQRIDADGMGMLTNLEVFDVEQQDDSTFKATHTFLNPLVDRELKITRLYTLNAGLDSVVSKVNLGKTQMKSEGEWIETGF